MTAPYRTEDPAAVARERDALRGECERLRGRVRTRRIDAAILAVLAFLFGVLLTASITIAVAVSAGNYKCPPVERCGRCVCQ